MAHCYWLVGRRTQTHAQLPSSQSITYFQPLTSRRDGFLSFAAASAAAAFPSTFFFYSFSVYLFYFYLFFRHTRVHCTPIRRKITGSGFEIGIRVIFEENFSLHSYCYSERDYLYKVHEKLKDVDNLYSYVFLKIMRNFGIIEKIFHSYCSLKKERNRVAGNWSSKSAHERLEEGSFCGVKILVSLKQNLACKYN